MPLTPSNPIALGAALPKFALPEPLTGRLVGPDQFGDAPALLVAFISNRCPYVIHIREAFAALTRDYEGRLQVLAINANDSDAHPEETPEAVAAEVSAQGYIFPYLVDTTQAVARAFDAACTPDLYLYGPDRTLFYHGQFDASRPKNDVPPTGADLRAALDALLAGGPAPADQVQSIGCNIKWREPAAAPTARVSAAAE